MKKICFLVLFLINFTCLTSADDYTNSGFTYCYNSFKQEEKKYLTSKKSFYDQLVYVKTGHDILLDFLYLADEEKFLEQLRSLRSFIAEIETMSNSLYFETHPNRSFVREPFSLEDFTTYAYHNVKAPLTDEERTAAYEAELSRHQKYGLRPKLLLTQESIQTLVSGQPYNFILNTENEAYISYEQRHRLKTPHDGTVLNSPGHTLLAGAHPVLSAGTFIYYKAGQKELYIIFCSSGHFHPQPSCLLHFKNYLIAQNIPEEAIFVLGTSYDTIISYLYKIKYGSKSTQEVTP